MGKINVIPLFPLIGVNHRQSIIHKSKITVYLYTTDEQINKFAIGYMINPSLHVNRVFREEVEECLIDTVNENTMKNEIYVMKNKDTCVNL